jgi:hypothetical protein
VRFIQTFFVKTTKEKQLAATPHPSCRVEPAKLRRVPSTLTLFRLGRTREQRKRRRNNGCLQPQPESTGSPRRRSASIRFLLTGHPMTPTNSLQRMTKRCQELSSGSPKCCSRDILVPGQSVRGLIWTRLTERWKCALNRSWQRAKFRPFLSRPKRVAASEMEAEKKKKRRQSSAQSKKPWRVRTESRRR